MCNRQFRTWNQQVALSSRIIPACILFTLLFPTFLSIRPILLHPVGEQTYLHQFLCISCAPAPTETFNFLLSSCRRQYFKKHLARCHEMTSWKSHVFTITLSTYSVREKGIPLAIQVLGGWRVKAGGTDPRSKISKSVCCSISLPPSYASLLAEGAPRALGQFCGWEDPGQNFRLPQGLWGNCRLSTKFAWKKKKQSMNKPLPFWQQRGPETAKIFPAIRLWEDLMQAWQQTWLGRKQCLEEDHLNLEQIKSQVLKSMLDHEGKRSRVCGSQHNSK